MAIANEAIAKEKEETESHEECINTAVCSAIALQSIRLFQSLLQKHCILFAHPPLPVYIYIVTFSLQVISNRYGSLLSAVAMGLNIPLQGSLFGLLHGDKTGQQRLQLPPYALHVIYMIRMWRTKH